MVSSPDGLETMGLSIFLNRARSRSAIIWSVSPTIKQDRPATGVWDNGVSAPCGPRNMFRTRSPGGPA